MSEYITRAQFEEYVEVTNNGVSNLFDGECICKDSKTGLTREKCRYIIKHFSELSKKFSEDS